VGRKRDHGRHLNVADDVEGLPIGLVSVSKSGGAHPLVWTSSTADINVGLKFIERGGHIQELEIPGARGADLL
jgi:hypothetical protein